MNANFTRTIFAILTVGIGILASIGSCTTDALTGTTACTAGWIPAEYLGYIVTAIGFGHLALKIIGAGTLGLTAPTVPVSSSGDPGTVTVSQVNSGPNK